MAIASGWGRKIQGGSEHKGFFFGGGMECQRKDSTARTRECFGLICGIDKKVSFVQLLRLRSVYSKQVMSNDMGVEEWGGWGWWDSSRNGGEER